MKVTLAPNPVDTVVFSPIAIVLIFSGLMILLPGPALAQVVIALDHQLEEYWVTEKIVAPEYPRMALRRGKMGCVAVAYIIQADGLTSDHKVLAFYPSDIFDKSAIRAVKQFEYSPAVQNPDKMSVLTLNVFTYSVTEDSRRDAESGEEKRELLEELCSKAGKKALESASVNADSD